MPFCVRHNLETIFNYSCADVEEMAAATRETRESQLRTEESTPKRGPSSTHLAAAETE